VGFSAQGFAIENRLSLDGSFGEEVQEELVRLVALAACGFKQAVQDAVVLQALIGASALDDFAHEDHRAQTALSSIVGGRDIGSAKAGKEQPWLNFFCVLCAFLQPFPFRVLRVVRGLTFPSCFIPLPRRRPSHSSTVQCDLQTALFRFVCIFVSRNIFTSFYLPRQLKRVIVTHTYVTS